MSKTVLITGASRGLGRAMVEGYAADGWKVHAVSRSAGDLEEIAGVTAHEMEVTDRRCIATLRTRFAEDSIDLLVNNAGYWGPQSQDLGPIDAEAWLETLRINTLAPYYVSDALLDPLARARGLVVTITSRMGSIGDNGVGGDYVYRSSKAAANMVMKSLARDVMPRGVSVIAMHPGWVQTDMGGSHAPLTIKESVDAMRRSIAQVTSRDTGKFLNYDGNELPW